MGKFGKHKFKALNKIAKTKKIDSNNVSNKVLKKKLITEKKVAFQKEVILKEVVTGDNSLVKKVSVKEIFLNDLANKGKKKVNTEEPIQKPKIKAVEKQKKRQKTQISDTKLLLNLMKKK